MHGFLFWFVFILVECLAGDTLCETDHIGFEAIAQLHSQIDDDQDGIIDRPESAGVSILSVQCELQFPLINSQHVLVYLPGLETYCSNVRFC